VGLIGVKDGHGLLVEEVIEPKKPGEKLSKKWVEMAVFFVVFAKMFAYSASL